MAHVKGADSTWLHVRHRVCCMFVCCVFVLCVCVLYVCGLCVCVLYVCVLYVCVLCVCVCHAGWLGAEVQAHAHAGGPAHEAQCGLYLRHSVGCM